jgi:hypothetical protein
VADTDIDTSSDEYKLKVVALFFGVHLLRKAAFWKANIGLSKRRRAKEHECSWEEHLVLRIPR